MCRGFGRDRSSGTWRRARWRLVERDGSAQLQHPLQRRRRAVWRALPDRGRPAWQARRSRVWPWTTAVRSHAALRMLGAGRRRRHRAATSAVGSGLEPPSRVSPHRAPAHPSTRWSATLGRARSFCASWSIQHVRYSTDTEATALRVAVLPVVLIRPVSRDLGVALGLEALACEQQPLFTRARNMIGLLPPALLKLAARFPRPTLASLRPLS